MHQRNRFIHFENKIKINLTKHLDDCFSGTHLLFRDVVAIPNAVRVIPDAHSPQPNPDEDVQDRNDQERHRVEQEGRDLEHVPDGTHDIARFAVRDRLSLRVLLEHDAELQGRRQGTHCGRNPYAEDGLDGPRKGRHDLGLERVADGHVSLHGERGDGQDRSVGAHLRGQTSQDADLLAEDVRVLVPEEV